MPKINPYKISDSNPSPSSVAVELPLRRTGEAEVQRRRIKIAHIITLLELGGAQENTLYTCENLDKNKFDACLANGKYDNHIQDNLDNATATGGDGTPWSIVVTESGKKYPLSGARSYAEVKQLIEIALRDK